MGLSVLPNAEPKMQQDKVATIDFKGSCQGDRVANFMIKRFLIVKSLNVLGYLVNLIHHSNLLWYSFEKMHRPRLP